MKKKEVVPQKIKDFVNRKEYRGYSQICVVCGSCHNKAINRCMYPMCSGKTVPLGARSVYNSYKIGYCKYIDKIEILDFWSVI